MRRSLVHAALAAILAGVPATSHALPAFARRYNLACGVCHSAVPRLNAYGEAVHMNGFKPPGTMVAPMPPTWKERLAAGLAVWARGEWFERSDYGRGPSPRQGFAVPELASLYIAGALTPSTSVFIELENTVHETAINQQGDFVTRATGGMRKAFLMVDLPMRLGLHGGHDTSHGDHAAMGHAGHGMDMPVEGGGHGMATMG